MLTRLYDQECAERRQRETTVAIPALPNWSILVLKRQVGEFIQHQQIRTLAIVRSADQSNIALSHANTRVRNSHRVYTSRLFAHKRPRRPGHTVNDRDVSGEKVG